MSLPLDQHESRVRMVRKWSAAARWAIATSAVLSVAQAVVRDMALASRKPVGLWWMLSARSIAGSCFQTVAALTELAHYVVYPVAVVAFLRWLVLIIRAARGLGADLKLKPSGAVLAFFAPVANLVLPVRDLRRIASALAPDRLPEPPVRVVADGSAGYREARLLAPPAAAPVPAALITLWWATYYIVPLGVGVASFICTVFFLPSFSLNYASVQSAAVLFGAGVLVVAAFCAMRMVRALTALLDERLRRIRHNPEEVLRQVGLVLE